LVYCIQAIAKTDKKVGVMKSHIAELEEKIDRVPVVRNKLLANDLESKNGGTDNPLSRNLPHQTTLPQSVFLRNPSRTFNPTRNDDFELDRTGKQVLKDLNCPETMSINLNIISTKKKLSKIIARRKRNNQDGDEHEERKKKTNANAHQLFFW
jgi:hypothetical protein